MYIKIRTSYACKRFIVYSHMEGTEKKKTDSWKGELMGYWWRQPFDKKLSFRHSNYVIMVLGNHKSSLTIEEARKYEGIIHFIEKKKEFVWNRRNWRVHVGIMRPHIMSQKSNQILTQSKKTFIMTSKSKERFYTVFIEKHNWPSLMVMTKLWQYLAMMYPLDGSAEQKAGY